MNESNKIKKVMEATGLLGESSVDDSRSKMEKDRTSYVSVFNTANDAMATYRQIGGHRLNGTDIEDISLKLIGVARQLEKLLNYNGFNIKL